MLSIDARAAALRALEPSRPSHSAWSRAMARTEPTCPSAVAAANRAGSESRVSRSTSARSRPQSPAVARSRPQSPAVARSCPQSPAVARSRPQSP